MAKIPFPTLGKWRYFFSNLNPIEWAVFTSGIVAIVVGIVLFATGWYLEQTVLVPKEGGIYIEGLVGRPQFLNPILAQTNEVDQAISRLLFAGLLSYDEAGNLKPDLAESWQILEEGRVIEVELKKNAFWQDGQPIDADDVLFTIELIQNPAYRSPLWPAWQGVKVEKINANRVRFRLATPYAPFLHNLTVGLLPKHRFEGIPPEKFSLIPLNLQEPLGSGPYQAERFNKDQAGIIVSYTLRINKRYFGKRPHLEKIRFVFFDSEQEAQEALLRREIHGLAGINLQTYEQLKERPGLLLHQGNLPRLVAVFFNQTQSKALADKAVRLALAYGTNKKELIEKVAKGFAESAESPIPPKIFGHTTETKIYDFAQEHAIKNLLEPSGWQDTDSDGIREKEGDPLTITLATLDIPELKELAQLLKEQWRVLGVNVEPQYFSGGDLRNQIIRPRAYQALLFGQSLALEPDPFAFWHSTRKFDPGQNLALYENKEVDGLLEAVRTTIDPQERMRLYAEFQKRVVDDVPAVFLYSPKYLYLVDKSIQGIKLDLLADPSWRFANIQDWYIRTKRVWK